MPIRLDKLPIPPKYIRFPNGPVGAIARSVLKTGHIIIPAPRFGRNKDEEEANILTGAVEAQITSDELAASTEAITLTSGVDNTQVGTGKPVDWRARLRPKGKNINNTFWQIDSDAGGLLDPLYRVGGLVWQYTPTLQLAGNANYDQHDFHGTNYSYMTYKNSNVSQIIVNSDFSANTIDEGRYMLGVIQFLRTATKSFYGEAAVRDGYYGTPPPVLVFEYLGEHGFNKVPVVVINYNVNFPNDVDYIPVKTNVGGEEETTFLPVLTNISVTLQPYYTPHKLRKKFDLSQFTNGKLYKDGFI